MSQTVHREFVSFAIGEDRYGVDIMSVREIKGWSTVSALPGQPDYVRGILNLRGLMVPIIDLRCRFGLGMTEATPAHVVIIVNIDSHLVGLLADQVLDIVSYDESTVQPVPRVTRAAYADLFSGLVIADEGMITLIALDRLVLSDTERAATAPVAA